MNSHFWYPFTPTNFDGMYDDMIKDLLLVGEDVDTGHWQAMTGVPHTKTKELQYVTQRFEIPATPGALASMVEPNLPWAENHFKERVSGIPYNPPPSAKEWPFAQKGHEEHVKEEKFSHTYPERMWPKWAGTENARRGPSHSIHQGIRFAYGDLQDLVRLLAKQPHTRQAYLPIWFPEDINAAAKDERVPCTLGYHFMVRQDKLHCFYPIRSCDLLRHWRDDVYMAARLVQWIVDELIPRTGPEDERDYKSSNPWALVDPGNLTMFIPSLHVFQGDLPALEKRYLR